MHSFVKPKHLIAAMLLGGAIAAAHAASAITKTGAEYRILPTLPGDQVQAQLAFGEGGGFLVTQDNSIDGNGLGIRARRFNADLSAAQNTFQVNAQNLGDQKNARVALLKGGGAVFAWESSTASGHRVVLRFLDAQDKFPAGDVEASRIVAGSQSDPVLAVLANGSVVVIWAEWDRDGGKDGMDGIYGQIFTATGARSGNTFRVNERTAWSQRTPTLTALEDGGFAVAWITDENRHSESIDIYGRIFSGDGTAVTSEFPLNAWEVQEVAGKLQEINEVCANPFLAPISGGFRAGWSERTSNSSRESWDVITRSFNVNGSPRTGEVLVNNTTTGDQFSPKIASAGETQLIVWTSFGQDGADEGIFGRLLNGAGEFDGSEFQVNTRSISKQLFPTLTGAGSDRYVVAWSSFVGGVASYDLFAQNYSLASSGQLAQPEAPFVSSLSQNTLCVTWNEVTSAPGTSYLVYVDNETIPSETSSGMLTISRATWEPGSNHTVKLAYRTADGKTSPLSDAVTVKTWGVDSNSDGLPDDWQQLYFGKWRPSGKDDTDGDGASNYEEFLAGTDPTDPTNVLRAQISGREQGLYIVWNTVPGNYYQLQVTSDFATWTSVGSPRFAHSDVDSLPCAGPGQVRYYRVIRMR